MSTAYVLPVRVYYEDTDHGGVVYYANYLKFMERCRTEFLRERGLEQDELINEQDLIFAVRRVEADYLQPAKFNDLLFVTAEIVQKTRVKVVFKQQVFKKKTVTTPVDSKTASSFTSMSGYFDNIEKITGDSILLCKAEVTIVSLSASKMQPKRILKTTFKEFMCEH